MGVYDNEIMAGVFRTDTVQTSIKDGAWHTQDGNRMSFLIADESKLDLLTGFAPGSTAHTAGFKKMWELAADGETWVQV